MRLTIEYLIIVDKETAEAFYHLCDRSQEFNKLLQTDPEIIIEKNVLKYKKTLAVSYDIKTNKIEGKHQRFFHIKLMFDDEESNIDEYSRLLKAIRGIVHRNGGQPETLWDDISRYYSGRAYPIIHDIENIMRHLITYFMLTTIGKEWVTETSPSIVKEAIDKSKRKQYLDVLYQVDFIHLGDFLFKPYSIKEQTKLLEQISSASKLEDLDLAELKSYIGRSNWQRFFSKIVECNDAYLDKRWKQLYELRCVIAHNALFSKSDYEKTVQLVDEVSIHLRKAIDNLNKIHVPNDNKEQIAEEIVSTIDKNYGEFIRRWRYLEETLSNYYSSVGLAPEGERRFLSPTRTLQMLREKDIINDELVTEGKDLIQFRHRLIHGAGSPPSYQEVTSYLLRLDEFIQIFLRSWKDEIISALNKFGGEASLAEIYDYIENNSYRKLPASWRSNIRYTLQTNCPETDSYKRAGGEALFQHLSKGRWGLRKAVE